MIKFSSSLILLFLLVLFIFIFRITFVFIFKLFYNKYVIKVWNMFKVNKKDIRTTPSFSGIFLVNFEHISHLVFVFLLLTLNM